MERTRIGKPDQKSPGNRVNPKPAGNTQVSRIQKLQQTFGNRALQRLLDAAATDESEGFASSLEQYSGSGNPLPGQARLFLEQQLGVDLSPVRIHTGQEAHELSRAVGATAFTTGADIFFKHGAYDPDSAEGMHLLAHETSHVVQQSAGSGEVDGQPLGDTGVKVSDPSDRFEQAAERTADRVMSGALIGGIAEQPGTAPSGAGQVTSIQRDDDDDDSWLGKIGGALSSAGSAVVSGVSDVGSAVASGASAVASGVSDVAGDVWQGAKGVAGGIEDVGKDLYGDMKAGAGYVRQGVAGVGKGIDWLEDEAKGGTHWLADKAKGIPVLEQVANAGESMVDTSIDIAGGVGKGVTGLVGGIAGMVVDPVDAAKGLYTMSEHIPGLGLPAKALHGAYDLAFTDKTLGQVANETLNPAEDAKYWGNVGKGLLSPLQQAVAAGKPGEAVGEVGVNIAALLSGAGEVGAAGEVGEAAELADAAEAADAAQIGEGADAAEAAQGARVPVDPNVNPFGPTLEPPPGPAAPTELPPDFLENPQIPGAPKMPTIPEPPPGGFPELPPGGSAASESSLTGMRTQSIGTPTGELSGLSDTEIDSFVNGIDSGAANSSTMFEFPGQNPATGGGLQDIREVINPNPNQINYSVNHYFSDVGNSRIADAAELGPGAAEPGASVIPEGAGIPVEPTPQTAMSQMPEDTPVLNGLDEPIGRSNVEARYHSANPAFPEQGPTVQVNTPSDRFGWGGDRNIAVEGEQGSYLLPDGSWKTIREMTNEERAAAHWPTQ